MNKNESIKKTFFRKIMFATIALFLCMFSVFAQNNVTVTGTVIDETEQPLPGASIVVKGTPRGVTTDVDGSFTIVVKTTDALEISFLGYQTQTIPIGEKRKLDIQLKPKANELDEVTVVAFGKQKKESVVSAIQTVNVNDLKIPSSNLTTAFAGRIPGLISFQTSGEPGADNAQFYIRGIQTFGFNVSPLILIDGFEATNDDLARLNVDDIESFSILKDAAASVMYGARGANGIITIVTKPGHEGSTKVSARFDINISTPTYTIKTLDAITYMNMYNEAQITRTPSMGLYYSQQKILATQRGDNPMIYPNVDWQKTLFKKSTTNDRGSVNISGGGKVGTYYVSASLEHETGLLNVDKMNNFNNNISINRMDMRSNVIFHLGPSTTLDTRISGRFERYNGPYTSATQIFTDIMKSNPVDFPPVYQPDVANQYTKHVLFGDAVDPLSGNIKPNPYAEMVKGYQDKNTSNITAQATLMQDLDFILKNLKFQGKVSTNAYSLYSESRTYVPFLYALQTYNQITQEYTLLNLNPTEGQTYLGNIAPGRDASAQYYYEGRLNWDQKYGNHNVAGMVVGMFQENLQTSGTSTNIYETLPERNAGISGRFSYNYDTRYFAEFSWGYNGSEKFTGDKRFGFFPAFGAGWLISNEKFWTSEKDLISNFKLKFTYGKVGNDAIAARKDRFFFLSEISSGGSGSYRFGEDLMNYYAGYTINRYPNPDITWELASKYNLGLELSFLKQEDIKFQIDLYKETRSQIYMQRDNFPSTAGLEAAISGNVGKVTGKGIDASLDIQHFFNKDFWLQGRVNFTYATNKYLELDEKNYPDEYLKKKGYNTNQQWGLIAERLFVDDQEIANSPYQDLGGFYQAGDIKYRDVNGDGVVNSNDRVPMGFPTVPEIQYGFGPSMGYKKFDFSFFFNGSARVSFFINATSNSDPNNGNNLGIAPFVGGRNALQYIANSYWSDTNPDVHAFWPRLSTTDIQNNTQQSSWWLRDGSFMRLKSVELGYNYSGLKKKGLSNARIYFNCQDLFAISPFKLWDPEMGSYGLQYPLNRVFDLGLQLQF